ncbi:triose-phosphate isomerase [Saccharobesus litoralis]|uniref:Triosephosphate isomerase n=1 Tax=Saccharobesus litoralis TaxID=2172099 RepID=A0A2S0VMH7_9ALTE|nr:triose-phosphate isomerase [Saccharobesus litoralis]AWB65423.1 triose-phosphate isomerase [Saccharobesus litoralis]
MNKRVPIVIANWKLNGGIDLLCTSVAAFIGKHFSAKIAICPPYLYLRDMLNFLQHSEIMIGTQNVSKYESGAYTGETSAQMIKEAGGSLCLIGHSERRQMFHENDPSCKIKVTRVLNSGLMPVLCVGENLQQREAGITNDVLFRQLHDALDGLDLGDKRIAVAYEPVWAIGTGKAATPEEAQLVHEYIRSELTVLFGKERAESIHILYGGSVNKNNAYELLSQTDIDGLLVGGASLDPEHFMQICLHANSHAEQLQSL